MRERECEQEITDLQRWELEIVVKEKQLNPKEMKKAPSVNIVYVSTWACPIPHQQVSYCYPPATAPLFHSVVDHVVRAEEMAHQTASSHAVYRKIVRFPSVHKGCINRAHYQD